MTDRREIPIEEAAPEQLRAFANDVLGLGLPTHTKDETVLARIKTCWKPDYITAPSEPGAPVQAEAAPAEERPAPPSAKQAEAAPQPPKVPVPAGRELKSDRPGSSIKDPKVSLIINEQPGPGGKRDVFVSVNGSGMMIPRGEYVSVPYRYYLVLGNAILTHWEQEDDGELTAHDVPNYPFQVRTHPPEEEIAAWFAAQAQEDIKPPETTTAAA